MHRQDQTAALGIEGEVCLLTAGAPSQMLRKSRGFARVRIPH